MQLPIYARIAAIAGRPIVLVAALAMSAPGEYELAVTAGWSSHIAWLMPVCVSVYAGVAAVIAATRPKGLPGRMSAMVGAGLALLLALSAQMTAHLIEAGYADSGPILVAAVSAVPPVVVAHMLHLAAMPRTATDNAQASPADMAAPADSLTAMAGQPEDSDRAVAGQQTDMTVDADSEADSPADNGRPTPDEIRVAVEALSAQNNRVATGRDLAAYFGVSDRTGRRYLSMAA